jgi:4-amino-4-deoxy-L-arabinose transferase-like glycosyltransferase
MNYWYALQSAQWFNLQWWENFWSLSSKIPPGTYILTSPLFNIFGTGVDAAILVLALFSALLLISVYCLGAMLFNRKIGLWAALLCQLIPGLYRYQLEFLLDYPLTAAVIFSFFCLALWKVRTARTRKVLKSPLNWCFAILFGLSLGFALMIKQTSLIFLFFPILAVFVINLWQRNWQKLLQFFAGLSASLFIFYPWYRTNWLLILTSGKRATLDSAIAEGDPALNTLDAWVYYLKILPYLLSWHFLIIPLIFLAVYLAKSLSKRKQNLVDNSLVPDPNLFPQPATVTPRSKWRWLAIFLIGGYLLSSLNVNKDARYLLPLLPTLSLLIAAGLHLGKQRWQYFLRWATIGLATVIMLCNLFPLGGEALTQALSPRVQHYPYTGQPYPHAEVIRELTTTSPYLQTTLGVLPSTPTINQHNFSYYGARAGFQVYGRQVGVREDEIEQDARSLDWFLTKTGDQGSVPPAQQLITQRIETGEDFQLQKSWQLPDESRLNLFHRIPASVEVTPIASSNPQVSLHQVTLPATVPPGSPVPVTYQWTGQWNELKSGLLLLSWYPVDDELQTPAWIQDHGVGMGRLHDADHPEEQTLAVIERTAMLPNAEILPGQYTLTATYLNRDTGQTYPIDTPPVILTLDPQATPIPAPELDLVTQLRIAALGLKQGQAGLEEVFAQTTRINQYDPLQDYLAQAEATLRYRLQETPNVNWAYGLALAEVLQQDAEGAIASLKQLIQLDRQNPYPYAYLAFVHLYGWNPKAAENALKPALALKPDLPELRILAAVANLLQGKVVAARSHFSVYTNSQQ